MSEPQWLTVAKVKERLAAAGYPDSVDTIRRGVDAGDYGEEGVGWYRTERSGYRYVSPAAVDALIARRRSPERRTQG